MKGRESLYDVLPDIFFHLLPKDLFAVVLTCRAAPRPQAHVPSQTFSRVPTEKDLERYVKYYAPRIREIYASSGDSETTFSSRALHTLHLLTGWTPGVLSPFARKLTWEPYSTSGAVSEEGHDRFPFFSLFLSKQITSLDIIVDPMSILNMTAVRSAVITLPGLAELTLRVTTYSALFSDSVIRGRSWSQLQVLTVTGLSIEAFGPTCVLPCVSKLTVHSLGLFPLISSSSPPDDGNSEYLQLPSLEELVLDSPSINNITGFIQRLPPTNRIRVLKSDCTADTAGMEQCQHLLNAVQEHCNPTALRHLRLRHTTAFMEEEVSIDFEHPLDVSVLFDFHNLETLHIALSAGVCLTPAYADSIPKAWPKIEKLKLGVRYPDSRIPLIDHTHLRAIIRGVSVSSNSGRRFDATKAKVGWRIIVGGSKAGIGTELDRIWLTDAGLKGSEGLAILRIDVETWVGWGLGSVVCAWIGELGNATSSSLSDSWRRKVLFRAIRARGSNASICGRDTGMRTPITCRVCTLPRTTMAPVGAKKSASSKRQKTKPNEIGETATFVPPQDEDLQDFGENFKKKAGFELKPFQLAAAKYQLQRRDVVVHAGTGSGKTAIVAAPHCHPSAEGMLTILVSPLLALQNEQVVTFGTDYKLKAIAVNSSHGGCSAEVLAVRAESLCSLQKRVNSGTQKLKSKEEGYQVLIISPELLLSRRFIDVMLRDKAFTSRILSVVVDEAHVVSHWGAGFRKRYGELGMIRAFLARGTSMVAMSATLSPRVRDDVLRKLEFSKLDYEAIDEGNDRPNVALVARAIEHTQESMKDLDFIIPKGVTKAEDIPLTMVYADSVSQGPDFVEHLNALLPPELRNKGLIRPFSAAFTNEYRTTLLTDFKKGLVRVLVCTDAAGMGCNIPAVDVVVQWKLPSSLSLFVQRAGRAARAPNRQGLAILLVERTAYNTQIDEELLKSAAVGVKKGRGKTTVKPVAAKRSRKEVNAHAIANGVKRGSSSAKNDAVVGACRDLEPNASSPDEGLLAFVQTTACRRRIVTKVYRNKNLTTPNLCCDLCNPELLNRCRPPQVPKKPRQVAKNSEETEEPVLAVQTALRDWRMTVHANDFPWAPFGPSALLSDAMVDTLASFGRITTQEHLSRALGSWIWSDRYSVSLLAALVAIPEEEFVSAEIQPLTDAVDQPALGKRKQRDEDDGGEEERRVTASAPIPSSINAASSELSRKHTSSTKNHSTSTYLPSS
ncbi:hypothetical protein NMY22_g11325 [Coprinellus aureogranulatus]|nr:hypothetical protein NMY22_g11325 [Coprinellus aureogranulatus]